MFVELMMLFYRTVTKGETYHAQFPFTITKPMDGTPKPKSIITRFQCTEKMNDLDGVCKLNWKKPQAGITPGRVAGTAVAITTTTTTPSVA